MTRNFKLSHFFSGCRHLLPVSNKAAASRFAADVRHRLTAVLSNATAAFSRC